MQKFNDEEFLKKLKSMDQRENDTAFSQLYRELFPKVLRYIQKNSGSFSQAEDIFQDSLLAFYKMTRRGSLPAEIRVEAYFFSISKNLWLKSLGKRKDIVKISETEKSIAEEDYGIQTIFTDERKVLLNELIKRLGGQCYQILILYYFEKQSMKEIAQLLGFSGSNVAKTQKSKCMKELKSLVLNTPKYKNYFR